MRSARLSGSLILLALAAGAAGWAKGLASGGPPSGRAPSVVPNADSRPEAIGELARQQGLAAARARLEPLLGAASPAAQLARVQLGLLAHAHEDLALAERWLGAGPGPVELEDWRLTVLADAAAAGGRRSEARRTLETLLAERPDSPLRRRTAVRLAQLAWEDRALPEALRLLERARGERLADADALELERLAWQIGLARRDRELLIEAGRRLLVRFPLEASKLRVVDEIAAHGGSGEWRLWLTPHELERRADALLAAELPAGALTTLAAVPPEARGLEWRLLEARALTASGRGGDALVVLAGAAASTSGERARLEWERARAATDAATVRRGPTGPAADERARLRARAREHQLAVVRLAPDSALAIEAWRQLATDFLAEERLDEALAALRQLVAAAPAETFGARPLWERGWREYAARNPSGAVGYWTELVSIFPRSSFARSARYWTGRAHEELGHAERAREIYLEVAAVDTADFYARQAAARLAGAPTIAAATAAAERDPWPEATALARARWLSELGLDGLAASELAALGDQVERGPARHALEGLIAARRGDRRTSLRLLRRAFPALGTARQAAVPEAALGLYYPLDFRSPVERAADREGLQASLVFGMIHQESGFDPTAKSRAGARGLMQIMPPTGREVAKRLGLPYSTGRLSEPDYSIRLGTHYFRQMLALFDGNVELALAGYNGGPGRISRLWRAAGPSAELDRFLEGLSIEESRNYVKRILVLADSYRSLYPELG